MPFNHTAGHVDVLIIGAGLSGIGAACHLQARCPDRSFAILEARSASGGTWDLFRYPGVRSDSDMFTLGYRFRPWLEQEAIADGPSILKYVRDTARDFGIEQHIRYGHRLLRASWSSHTAMWTATVEVNGTRTETFTCNLLYSCMGYYDYAGGFTPVFPNAAAFTGPVVHPQQWPDSLDYRNKRVLVIGSGATAITLVPAMAKHASHVTMLQRSPTYVMARPTRDNVAQRLRTLLPERAAYAAIRWKNVALSIASFHVARRYPEFMKQYIMKHARKETRGLIDVESHFQPRYNPWDERMCLAPDADIFRALTAGTASVVTADIRQFTSSGVELTNGDTLDADIIVTATGLNLRLLSGIELVVDGASVQMSQTMAYKGMMFSDVPNFVAAFGYTNASWTLKCDLTAEYTCRLLNYLTRRGYRQFTPRQRDPSVTKIPVLDFTSGYVQRALSSLPSQGSKTPWRVHQNYLRDMLALRYGRVNDGVMEFV